MVARNGRVQRGWVLVLCLVLLGATSACRRPASGGEAAGGAPPNAFAHWMNVGKNYYDKGEALKAIEPFREAVGLNFNAADAHLNLANAFLLANQPTNALTHALQAAELDRDLAAAHYVAGCASMRLRQYEAAVKSFQIARDIEPKVGAATFQLARAHQELGHWDEAIALFQELVGFEPEHPTAWYTLSQALIRAGRPEEANAAIEKHRAIVARKGPGTMDLAKLERCVHTEARAPFIVEPPDPKGIAVRFLDVTATVLPEPSKYRGPLGFIDYNRDGRNSLFAGEGSGFRLLINSNGLFQPQGQVLPGTEGARYRRCLVADLQNDRFSDVLVVGDQGTKAFRFATNAQITDSSAFSRLGDVRATEGVLVDLDFTGKLDLLAVDVTNRSLRVMRNLGNLYFKDITATSGIPATVTGVVQVVIEDWNNDEQLDAIVTRVGQPPLLLIKPRGAVLQPTNTPPDWPAGEVIALGDFNNDLRGDLFLAAADHLEAILNGIPDRPRIPVPAAGIRQLFPVDYDNDGWLDLLVVGNGLRMFRNLGEGGFQETTAALGLDAFGPAALDSVAAADIDMDGDTDLALGLEDGGLRVLRNEGGNGNLQVKVRLLGNRSNANGFGTRVEVTAGGLRIGRRVASLPVEIGVGQHRKLESLNARWLNLSLNNVDVEVDPRTTLDLLELSLPEGSCPYLYVWDGHRFRFTTDLLGAAPLGLRVSEHRFVEADPDEYVWLGDMAQVQPREGHYVLQITEELREVLYLDAAELVAVDHPEGTAVYPTGKMVPGRPFPPHTLVTLHQPQPPRRAIRSDGVDATEAVRGVDQQMIGPVALRRPQLRGLAEPWQLTLDFGPLPVDRPLVLAMTGWLRFGGGMANVAASHDPDLPFPFPTLEVETAPERWQTVDLVFGVPCGKTKNLITDLTGKLPPGSRRLRLSTAYELYWDHLALMEKTGDTRTRVTRLKPVVADLHYRGFGVFKDLPPWLPLTPSYEHVTPNPPWRITPAGWCTRYGDVRELVQGRDSALALLNGGDELTLKFDAAQLPPPDPGFQRSFFLYSCGWDKDSDFHCEKGWEVGPLPWHGLDDQLYGHQQRPVIDGDWWIGKYNTRWVGPWVPRRRG